MQNCQRFVSEIEEQEREDLREKSLQRAKELGLSQDTETLWGPTLHEPAQPQLRRRQMPLEDSGFRNISRAQMDRAVIAYDCSVPTLLETVQIPERKAADCGEQRTRVLLQRNATLNILQHVDAIPMTVYRCKVKKTTIPTGCGMHSHQWLVHPMVEIEREESIHPDTCKKWWESKVYHDPRGKSHNLQHDSRNTIYSYLAGAIDTSAKDFGACAGEAIRTKEGVLAQSMVVSQHITIDLYRFEATTDRQGRVHLTTDDRSLPCNVLARSCVTNSGSYFWDKVEFDDHCPLYQTRQASGIVVTDEGGRRSFISRDNSLLRLRLRGEISYCNQTVWETNFQKILVTEDLAYPDFTRPLTQALEASLVTYVNAQDYFLAGFLTERIQREHDLMQKTDCLQLVEERQLDYASLAAAQNVPVEGTTVALGAGFFASSRGDAYVKYRCKSLLVMARNVDRCYAALPVTLLPRDENAYRLARGWEVGTNATDLDFFVAPNSHLLTTKGIEVECVPMMAPMFRGAYGSWITHTPQATFVSAEPARLQLTRQEVEEADKWELPDFEQGGVYEKDFVLAMDRQRQLSRSSADVAITLGRKAEETGWNSGMLPAGGGFQLPGVEIPTPYDLAVMAFKEFGIIVAGLIGLFGIAFLLTWGACCVCRLQGMPFHPEATRVAHTAVAIVPSLGNYLRRRHPRYRTPEDQPGIPLMTREQPGAILQGPGQIFSPLATQEFPPSAPSYQANPEGQPEPPVPENTFGVRSPLLPRRQTAALGNYVPPQPSPLEVVQKKIKDFEALLRIDEKDDTTSLLTNNILREVKRLKGQIDRALTQQRPLNEQEVAEQIAEIRRRYFRCRSEAGSKPPSRRPSPTNSQASASTLRAAVQDTTPARKDGAGRNPDDLLPPPPPPPMPLL